MRCFQKRCEKMTILVLFWNPFPIFWGPKTPPFRATAIAGYLQITYLKQIKKEKGDV